jgi:hypothetical protein
MTDWSSNAVKIIAIKFTRYGLLTVATNTFAILTIYTRHCPNEKID